MHSDFIFYLRFRSSKTFLMIYGIPPVKSFRSWRPDTQFYTVENIRLNFRHTVRNFRKEVWMLTDIDPRVQIMHAFVTTI